MQGQPVEMEDYTIAIAPLEPIGTRGYIELWPVTERKA